MDGIFWAQNSISITSIKDKSRFLIISTMETDICLPQEFNRSGKAQWRDNMVGAVVVGANIILPMGLII